jgi:hypothetical protein
MEERSRPAVGLCNEAFLPDARSAASGKGMPGLRLVSESVPAGHPLPDQIRGGITPAVIEDIVGALTRPLKPEEASPRLKEPEKTSRIVFKGTLEEVNRFFYKRGWTDGFPVLPPTEEAVKEMLAGTDLPPDHLVTKIIPRMGKATVEKIAINAVLAGALPTYMPVLIAGLNALMEPPAEFGTWQVSTGSWNPFWIINGPIRKDLHINSGVGALSPGDIANAAIGRAMGLIIKNIGGARKGIEDMGVLGNPGKYTMVIAENEEESPWEPMHVEAGLKREDSAVTVFFPNCYEQAAANSGEVNGILSTLIDSMAPGQRERLVCFILIPAYANTLASKGWTKKDLKIFVSENAVAPYYQHPYSWGLFGGTPPKTLPANPQDSISLISNPESIRVMVAGGVGTFIGIVRGSTFESTGGRWSSYVTKKVELPSRWNELVEKYKGLVPTYAKY